MLEKFISQDNFINIPAIYQSGMEAIVFPNLLPNIEQITQQDFPIFSKNNRIYLDSAATTQVPQTVKDRIHNYRSNQIRANNHSKFSTEAVAVQLEIEGVRKKMQDFFNAHNYLACFTSGTTDTSNWIASRFPFNKNDVLIISEAEHNSQILTARNFARKSQAKTIYMPTLLSDGKLDLQYLEKTIAAISKKWRHSKILLNVTHVSNVTGIVSPIREIRNIMGDRGFIYLDMAQSAGHMPIDLDLLDVDFAGLSAHKMYGPMGVGALFINKRSERFINNSTSGGSAVQLVSKWFTKYAKAPERFEPGTQNLEGIIEFGYVLDYLQQIGMDKIEAHDQQLCNYFVSELAKIKKIEIYGQKDFSANRVGIVTFNIKSNSGIKNCHELAAALDKRGISVRSGCFCAHIYTAKLLKKSTLFNEISMAIKQVPVMSKFFKKYEASGATRISFAFYNTIKDVYSVIEALKTIVSNID